MITTVMPDETEVNISQGATSQRTVIFVLAAGTAWNLTKEILSHTQDI
jgi:hypothetical protein